MSPIHNKQGERLDVAFHEGPTDTSRADRLVIIGHGVTGDKDRPLLIAIAEALAAKGWPCLRISFSGNGESEGQFTDSNITKGISDLTAIIDQLGNGKKIAYIGHSMGGAIGTLTAARDDRINVLGSLAGMVYTRAFVTREFGEITPDEGDMWDEAGCPLSSSYVDDLNHIDNTLAAVRELRLPWLLIHGQEDDVVPLTDSQDFHRQLRGPNQLLEIPAAGHSFEGHHQPVCEALLDWLKKHL
jgi:pimeloyl-ACP methyl ester carboxylesterase